MSVLLHGLLHGEALLKSVGKSLELFFRHS